MKTRPLCTFASHYSLFAIGYSLVFSSFLSAQEPRFKPFPLVSEKRLELTREYCRDHYGLDSHKLESPRILVIHFTGVPTLKQSLALFKPDEISGQRKDLKDFGRVNVGVHFLVDKNGDVYSLLPEDVVGRHVIGLNHVALGVENVARGPEELTEAQLEADRKLVEYLARKYPSLEYLIGHHEYARKDLPHYGLYKELNPGYRPTLKQDPGPDFMRRLRERLKGQGIVLKD